MQITSTFKGCFRVFFISLLIAVAVFCVFIYFPQYEYILGGAGMLLIFGFIFYVNIGPIVNSVAERASDVMAIYIDKSGHGLHIFTDFTTSRIKLGLCPLCTIQYYFLVIDTHKLYYKVLFTYEMESASGHSGYVDFSSFEEDVLGGEDLNAAMATYSIKTGMDLALGQRSREGEDESFETVVGDLTFKIVSKEGPIMSTLKICCYDLNGKLLWGKKI